MRDIAILAEDGETLGQSSDYVLALVECRSGNVLREELSARTVVEAIVTT